MLLGLHAGDSLGAPVEFSDKNPSLDHRSMIDCIQRNHRKGAATDDTALALLVLKAMPGISGLDINRLRKNMIDYLDSNPPGIGIATAAAIGRMKNGMKFGGTQNEDEQGNGSLMRVAPLALLDLPIQDHQMLIDAQASLTHAHPNCIFADRCFVQALKNALRGKPLAEVRDLLRESLLANKFFSDQIANAHLQTWDDLPNSGWVVHSLHVLVWSLFNCTSFEDALIKVVNLGGDADTNGAICGAMWGAVGGVEAIPKEWLEVLEHRNEIGNLVY